ncbi:MAG: MFS transporter [Chloroflexi bacterium]|nr:MFS transporter [Chloroflexota bacterium]
MQKGLGIEYAQAGMLATGNFVGYFVFTLVGGMLAARFGPKRVISTFMLLTGLAMFSIGLAPSFEFALAMQVLIGLSVGGANVPALALPQAWFKQERRGLASGIAASGVGISLLASGQVVPRIISTYGDAGWRYSWHLFGILAAVIGIIGYIFIKTRPNSAPAAPQVNPTAENKPTLPVREGPASPLRWSLVYRSGTVWYLALIYIIFGFSYPIYSTFFAAYLTRELGVSAQTAGDLWVIVGIGAIASGFVWGMISDWIGRRYAFAGVFGVLLISQLLFAAARGTPAEFVPVVVTLSALLFGFGLTAIPGIMAAACGDYVGPRLAPAAMGFTTVVHSIGQAIGPSAAGYLRDATQSFVLALILAAAVAFIGLVISLRLKPPQTTT